MKLLVLAKAYPPETGGVETYSEQVAQAYARAGHAVTVLTAHPGARGAETRGGVQVINVGQDGGQGGVFARLLAALWRLRGQSFDAVHATTWRVALPVLLLRRALPLVVTIHGREVFVVPRVLRPALRRVMAHAQLIPTVSQPILDKVRDELPLALDGAFANWNGISFPQACRVPHDKPAQFTLSCMCRMVARKNVAGAICAVAALVRQGHDIRFVVAGSGPELQSLRSLVAREGMADHIEILGRIPDADIVPLYRNSHVFLHPQIATRAGQDMEGFGLTIADAMSFGTVPVAGASGGPLDFIASGQTGYLVNGEDHGDIETVLRRLIEDRAHWQSLSRATQDFACAEITWERHAAAILSRLDGAGGTGR